MTGAQQAGRIAIGRTAAEIGGFGVFFGSTLFLDNLVPNQVNWLKEYVAKHFVKYHLAASDKIADKLRAVEGEERTAARHKMTPEEKARYYANYIVDYGIKIPVSFAAQVGLSNYVFPKLGLPKPTRSQNWMTLAVDEVPKWGSFFVFNTVIPNKIDHVQQSVSKILQSSTGMSKDRADTYSVDAMNIVVPNSLGLAASIAYLYKTLVMDTAKHR